MSTTYCYSVNDLIRCPMAWERNKDDLSPFDVFLQKKWNEAMKNRLFRYDLDDCRYKVVSSQTNELKGWCGYALLNPKRGTNKRAPFRYASINTNFSQQQFNFTKVNEEEILFYLNRTETSNEACKKHAVIINVSPMDRCHVMLVPDIAEGLPQQPTRTSLLMAFDLVELSSQPGFRVGFNSIHAWASINHLHWHAMYGDHQLYVDNLPVLDQVGPSSSSCFTLDHRSPIRGFVFNVRPEVQDRHATADAMIKVIVYFHQIETPYNILITRGCKIFGTRAFLWPRKSTHNVEIDEYFNIACIEAGGHFPVRSKAAFESLTLSEAFQLINRASLDHSEFQTIQQEISTILCSN